MKEISTGDAFYMLALLVGIAISAFYENPYFLAFFSIAILVKQLGRINTTLKVKSEERWTVQGSGDER